MFEALVDNAHLAIASLAGFYQIYSKIVLLQFPNSQIYPLCGNAIAAALKVYELNSGKPKQYWAHSFTLVLLTGFGGGFVAPMMLGKPCAPVTNDLVLPTVIITWYLIHYVGFDKVFNFLPIKVVWSFFVALFRTHAVCNMVALAADTIKAGPYYPCALVGPIIIGTATGSLGQFFPFDKGLSALTNGLPWPIQGALMTSVFFHLSVNDKTGFVGIAFRSVFGSHSDSEVRIIVATVQIITLIAQTIFSPSANLFTPFHKLFYLIFQVEGPKGQAQKPGETVGWSYNTRLNLERIVETSRVLAVGAVALSLFYSQPKSKMTMSNPLQLGQSIGTCQLLSNMRSCDPYMMVLEAVTPAAGKEKERSSYTLTSYKSLQSGVLAEVSPTWQIAIPKSKKGDVGSTVSARLSDDGTVRVVSSNTESEQEEQLWTSSAKCPARPATSTIDVTLSLNSEGKPTVYCSDGSQLLLA